MKQTLLIFILMVNCAIYGQINVGPVEGVRLSKGEFEQADLDALKSSKTIFIYRDSEKETLDMFTTALDDAWNYTDLEFVPYSEFASRTYDEKTSFFTIGGVYKVKTSSSGMVTKSTYIYLSLWMKKDDKKLTFCRIELYPSFETHQEATRYAETDEETMMKHLYEESTLHNWNPLYLKNALQFVNNKLTNSEEHWLYNNEAYSGLSALKKNTLYIPDYTLIKFSPFSGDESKRHDIKKLFKKYPYPYKVVAVSELADLIMNSTDDIYYLSYIKSSSNKYVSIFNGKTGDLLYSQYSPVSYNIKDKDIGKILKEMK